MLTTPHLLTLLFVMVTAIDYGPSYSMDYAGLDYNVTYWNSPPSNSPDNWKVSALQCQSICAADPNCCTWTYVNPEGGGGERCCLKYGVPPEQSNLPGHWTGAAQRAIQPECNRSSPPYPGPSWAVPQIHNTPGCLHIGGWHDIAGALFWKGVYHVFQGCPGSGGWHHASSTNLVHWINHGIVLKKSTEPYGDVPCSGFVTVDDDGNVCAGYRLCSGDWPNKPPNDVPLELRCALDDTLNSWGEPEYLYWFQFNRPLPYDPVRPWKGTDGKWYSTIAADGCNTTGTPCGLGGRAYMYTSPRLRGPGAAWVPISQPMFTSNYTVLTPYTGALLDRELVTAEYIGALPGDPLQGATRVLLNNVAGNGCCDGTTAYFKGTQPVEGGPFLVKSMEADTGMFDWGAFIPTGVAGMKGLAGLRGGGGQTYSMARTLSTFPNQVTELGRRTLVGWLQGPAALQSLPRDLSFERTTGELLQQFSPELATLRRTSGVTRSQQAEIFCLFTVAPAVVPMFGLRVLMSEDATESVQIGVDLSTEHVFAKDRAGPFIALPDQPQIVRLHAFIDHQIVTMIVNNRTALTVFSVPSAVTSDRIELFGVDNVTVNLTFSQIWDLSSIH